MPQVRERVRQIADGVRVFASVGSTKIPGSGRTGEDLSRFGAAPILALVPRSDRVRGGALQRLCMGLRGEEEPMSLHQFLVDNRPELIKRTRARIAAHSSPRPSEAEMEHGVPFFLSELLSQLSTALRDEGALDPAQKRASSLPSEANIARSGALHGQNLGKFGFSIEQVVRDYGDVCQAVTELADDEGATVTAAEFHTLNRCLDSAIAGAVTSWSQEREKSLVRGEGRRDRRLLTLVDAVAVSFDALRAGRVGGCSNTAAVVEKCLVEMRSVLTDPERPND
jgi:hypothetical protein